MVKKYRRIVLWTLTALMLVRPASADAPIRRAAEPVRGEYIVVLNLSNQERAGLTNIASELTLRGRGRLLSVLRNGVVGFCVALTEEAATQLASDPRVAWIEENSQGHLSYDARYFSDDTYWHLDRMDQRTPIPQWPTKAYAWTSTGQGVDVYVVDTGVWSAHSEFSLGNVDPGANFAVNDGYLPTNPCGGSVNRYAAGHGTAVASVIGGRTVGVAPNATIIPVKIGSCTPNYLPPASELSTDAISVITSLDWILGQVRTRGRRAVVNMSFFFTQYRPDPSNIGGCWDETNQVYDCRLALENNVRNLLNADVVVVTSANNQNTNRCADQSPARMGYGGMYDPGTQPTWPFVITVGGTDINDGRYQCPSCAVDLRGSNYGACVDIYAPASKIHAAHLATPSAYRDEAQWAAALQQEFPGFYDGATAETWSTGTSFAAPIVAGAAARLLQTFPLMSNRQVWETLKESATLLPSDFDGDGIAANDKLIYVSPTN